MSSSSISSELRNNWKHLFFTFSFKTWCNVKNIYKSKCLLKDTSSKWYIAININLNTQYEKLYTLQINFIYKLMTLYESRKAKPGGWQYSDKQQLWDQYCHWDHWDWGRGCRSPRSHGGFVDSIWKRVCSQIQFFISLEENLTSSFCSKHKFFFWIIPAELISCSDLDSVQSCLTYKLDNMKEKTEKIKHILAKWVCILASMNTFLTWESPVRVWLALTVPASRGSRLSRLRLSQVSSTALSRRT